MLPKPAHLTSIDDDLRKNLKSMPLPESSRSDFIQNLTRALDGKRAPQVRAMCLGAVCMVVVFVEVGDTMNAMGKRTSPVAHVKSKFKCGSK
ncbi:hypothetical protein [Paraburkholderia humisilvae]|uniref:Uncharacterized protein n=1 Tax=Paraburkholderia humisilvae TaxID=627669 RepID=A0A6J5F782_9BURK|nr:hypothetical protein [Paraburkholderia humisilvae]CAB3773641.1 hypothetical protein LMG29542_07358 [Paraburkholderia humisilvae]